MQIIKYLFVLSIIALSCKSDQSTTTVQEPKTTKDPQITRIMNLLQGDWRSLDDIGAYIVFEGDKRAEYRRGMETRNWHYFEIADQCNNDTPNTNKVARVKNGYISFKDIDMCYYIISVDAKELKLSYVGRGNTLTYKKVTRPPGQIKSKS